jgi:Flp pilus assembly protein TadD
MLTIKNQVGQHVILLVAAVTLFAGCGPAGPRALFKGKKLIEAGRYEEAIAKLKTATLFLNTNAQAWNYLGLAYHQAGQSEEAAKAYSHALALDHDLSEAHYNLGCLWLAQNKFEAAKTEFTAFTLRRSNSLEGFLKLGTTELRSHELAAAEKTFNEALRLSPQNPEALSGLGLVRLQRGRPDEAAQHFNKALKQQPDYAPALLNLAIVQQEYLNERTAALQKYREYLASRPPPENADSVRAVVRQLEQELASGPRPVSLTAAPQPNTNSSAVKPVPYESGHMTTVPKAPPTNASHLATIPKADATASASRPAPATNVPKPVVAVAPAPTVPLEMVKLSDEPVLKPAEDLSPLSSTPRSSPSQSAQATSSVPAGPQESKTGRHTLLQRPNPSGLQSNEQASAWRGASAADADPGSEDTAATLTPDGLSSGTSSAARYVYKTTRKPAPGNRADAERSFAQGVQAQEAQRLPEAIQAYRRAAQVDPSYFDAYYNLGLAASALGNLPLALSAYESALAVRSESLDARYNFALLLKQANYPLDAAQELEKLLVKFPNDSRTHLALGNLYAQQLHQPAKARSHYLKVLEMDPRNPQAGAIRYWLTDIPR